MTTPTSRRSPHHPRLTVLLLAVWLLSLPHSRAFAQLAPPPIHYAYDELGRLIAVIDRNGDAGVYTYDAVGNILSIERVNAVDIPGPIGITLVAPGKGKPGTAVTIFGKGFGTSAAQVFVAFNGTATTVRSVVPNRITTVVPPGATTGPILITAALGRATSPKPFKILGPITIDPPNALVGSGRTQQFAAVAAGGATASAVWLINGVVGGDVATGTVSTTGLYTAPATILASRAVTLTAIDRDDVTSTASVDITLVALGPIFLAARGVGVARKEPITVNQSVGARVSAAVAPPAMAPALAPTVAVTVAPVVTSMVPTSASRGASGVLMTITGAGLTGASNVVFLSNNVADATISVASVVANPEGTQLTADVSIPGDAALGGRVVRVVTPAGPSTAVGTGGNVFTVQ